MTEGYKNCWHITSYECIQLQQLDMPLPTATLVQEHWRTMYKHSYVIRTGPVGLPWWRQQWWWSQVLSCLQYFFVFDSWNKNVHMQVQTEVRRSICAHTVEIGGHICLSNRHVLWLTSDIRPWHKVQLTWFSVHPLNRQVSSRRWQLLWWVCTPCPRTSVRGLYAASTYRAVTLKKCHCWHKYPQWLMQMGICLVQ